MARWSNAEITRRLVVFGVVVQIAASTMGCWLAVEKIKLWWYHSWQRIPDPQAFPEQASPVLPLNEQAREWLKQGVWIVSLVCQAIHVALRLHTGSDM